MPIRFNTPAANADLMGADAEPGAPSPGMSESIGADGTPRDRADRTDRRKPQESERGPGTQEPKAAPALQPPCPAT